VQIIHIKCPQGPAHTKSRKDCRRNCRLLSSNYINKAGKSSNRCLPIGTPQFARRLPRLTSASARETRCSPQAGQMLHPGKKKTASSNSSLLHLLPAAENIHDLCFLKQAVWGPRSHPNPPLSKARVPSDIRDDRGVPRPSCHETLYAASMSHTSYVAVAAAGLLSLSPSSHVMKLGQQ
jgi:hypothetical protein